MPENAEQDSGPEHRMNACDATGCPARWVGDERDVSATNDLSLLVADAIERAHIYAIRATEWSGRRDYNRGWVPSCPSCHGVKPGYWHGWLEEAHGHSEECALRPALDWIEEGHR